MGRFIEFFSIFADIQHPPLFTFSIITSLELMKKFYSFLLASIVAIAAFTASGQTLSGKSEKKVAPEITAPFAVSKKLHFCE